MKRREFVGTLAAAMAFPAMAVAGSNDAMQHETLDYEPGLIDAKLSEGATVFVDYAADWCGTCRRQERIISELRKANPDLDEHITFVRVDWDLYGSDSVATSRNIPRRSTLLLLKGDQELGRIVAGTQESEIRGLLEMGLPS